MRTLASITLCAALCGCGGTSTPTDPSEAPYEEAGGSGEVLLAGPTMTVGVSYRYGGAVVTLDTPYGQVLDNSNGGTLLSTAIWTLPADLGQTQLCEAPPCESSLPFANPTQGGYVGDGHAGNPYPTSIKTNGSTLKVAYRAVNYNYGWGELDRPGWETDWYGDLTITFKGDILSIVTRITYCKSGGCEPMVTQDNQLSTFFGRGQSHPDPAERGPFVRATADGCVLDAEGQGVCLEIPEYAPIEPRFGISTTDWPSVAFIQPDLERFAHSGVTGVDSVRIGDFTYSDIRRFRFQPGGWYEFETLISIR